MLPSLGLVTIVVLPGAILSKRMSPLVALVIVPIAASLPGGFGFHTSKFVVDGLKSLVPVVGMFVFEILYFGTIADAGALCTRCRLIRYELPVIAAFNFVLGDALGGGVTRSLALDAHGKSLSSALIDLDVPAPTSP